MKNKKNIVIVGIALLMVALLAGAGVLYGRLANRAGNTLVPASNLEAQSGGQQMPSSLPASPAAAAQDDPNEGLTAAANFTVYNSAGDEVKLSDLQGKPVVLNFWASWCPPCKGEMPDFQTVYEEMGEDVHFMMVDLVDGGRETQELGAAFIEEQGYTFPVYYDNDQSAAIAYGITAIPTTVFINADGYIVSHTRGALSADALRQGLDLTMG